MRAGTGLGLVFLVLSAVSSAESLADAAKREQERRRKIREEGSEARVIGQDEVSRPTPRPRAGSEAGATGRATASPQPIGEPSPTPDAERTPDEPAPDEQKSWASRASVLDADIAGAEAEVTSVAGELAQLRSDRPEMWERQETLEKKLEALQERLKAARQAREDLEDEARRKNIPPGWLRGQFR
jgi:hypothetical protein